MGFNSNSGTVQAEVVISGAIGLPSPTASQTMKNTGRITGTGAPQTLFTAAAGKTAYVYAIVLYGTAVSGVNILDHASANIMDLGIPAANSNAVVTSSIPFIKVAAGETLQMTGANTNNITVFYFEE